MLVTIPAIIALTGRRLLPLRTLPPVPTCLTIRAQPSTCRSSLLRYS